MPSNDADAGMRLARMGRFAEALPLLERANRADPANPEWLHATASLLQMSGRLRDAAGRYQAAAERKPRDTAILVGWARALLLAGDAAAAIDPLDRALALDPRVAARDGMLRLLWSEEEKDAAASVLRVLVERHPGNADLLCQFAQVLRTAEHLDEAQSAWNRYVELRPDDPLGPVEAGRLAVSRGDGEAARHWFGRALAIAPEDAAALAETAHLERGALDEALLQRLMHAVERSRDPESLSLMHDALARHFERSGQHDLSEAHVQRMNAAQESALAPNERYDAARHADEVAFATNTYTRGLIDRLARGGLDDRRPLFVVGLPRSGTTLLERMLAAHPGIVGVGEQPFARQSLVRALAMGDGLPGSLTPQAIGAAARWHLDRLLERLQRLGIAKAGERIVDKLPDNYLLAGWIRIAFPQARIVHVLRDPRDVAWSCWSTQFAKIHWSLRLDHIAHRIEQHRRMLRHWRAHLGDALVEVRYERLVAEPEAQLRRVLGAAGMPWHADVMDFAAQKGFVASASRHQVREGVNARSVGRWRRHETALAPILRRLEAIVAMDEREAGDDLVI